LPSHTTAEEHRWEHIECGVAAHTASRETAEGTVRTAAQWSRDVARVREPMRNEEPMRKGSQWRWSAEEDVAAFAAASSETSP
jgi:hypothetical protein